MRKSGYSIIGLIKYIINLFIAIIKNKDNKNKEKSDKVNTNIVEKFNKIDERKENEKKKDIQKRLNDMFN